MTEQPVETEQQFLGNETHQQALQEAIVSSFAGDPLTEAQKQAFDRTMQHYVPNAHRGRFSPLRDKARTDIQAARADHEAILEELAAGAAPVESPNTDLQLEAEVHAGHAARSLENGELDAGIAWLQSALAFAQNARHSREFAIEAGAL